MLIDRLTERIPDWLGRPISIAGGALALGGALLVLAATAYGAWSAVVWAVLAFALAGLAWQVADRLGARHLGRR